MPPRIPIRPQHLRLRLPSSHPARRPVQSCLYATATTATTPALPFDQTIHSVSPISRYPLTQPPSHKRPEFRKSQLHRQYQSLLRSSPLILLFQHNNLKANEWAAIRREVYSVIRKVDEKRKAEDLGDSDIADAIKVQILQTGIFASALKVVEFFRPESQPEAPSTHPSDPKTATSAQIPNTLPSAEDERLRHGLSKAAWKAASNRKLKHGLEPLLSGPLCALTLPSVSPAHLAAILPLLAPNKDFPAPKRRAMPGYYDPAVQAGVQKLMLLGARIEGKVFDMEGAKWVGGIQGGLEGLRAQLAYMLQGVGGGLTSVLEGAGKSLYFTLESRRSVLEEEGKPKDEEKKAES